MSYGVAVGSSTRQADLNHPIISSLVIFAILGLSLPVGRRRARNGSLVWLSALPSAIGPIGC
jgi:hypothetical protein